MTTAKQSKALALVRLVSENAQQAIGHSWIRLNGAICDAVMLAITAGLRFDVGDFAAFAGLRGGRWMLDGAIERWYARAVEFGNTSACVSFEAWRGREIFQNPDGSGRLAVGSSFRWENLPVEVTSFGAGKLTACCCVTATGEHMGSVVQRRFTITPEELLAARKVARARTQTCHGCKAEVPSKKVGRTCPSCKEAWIHADRRAA